MRRVDHNPTADHRRRRRIVIRRAYRAGTSGGQIRRTRSAGRVLAAGLCAAWITIRPPTTAAVAGL